MIVDTSFLIDLMDKKEYALEKFFDLTSKGVSLIIPSIVVFELYIGVGRGKMPKKEQEKVKSIVDSQINIPFDSRAAKIAGELEGRLKLKGKKIGSADTMIAGIALANNDILLTGNPKHFNQVKGLQIESY